MMRRIRRALVTGGAGFIGSNLAGRLLADAGAEVAVLDDLSSGYRRNLDALAVRLVEGNVRDPAAVARAVDGCDTVFHLAASVGNTRSIEHPVKDSEVNVIGTLRVLEASRAAGVERVVFSSSAGIFGEIRQIPIAEDHPTEPGSPYGVSKLAAEKHCLAYALLYGLHAVCLRYFNVYGVNQRYDAYGNVIPIFVHRLLRGAPLTVFGDGEQTRDFVNVGDVVQANLQAAAVEGLSGAFNVGSGAAITINELVRLVGQAMGVAPRVESAPPRKGDVRHSRASIEAARRMLGYEPAVPLDVGLHEYADWVRRESGAGGWPAS